MNHAGQWLSLMEYANQNHVSLSTLRRHIKADKVRYRIENGRYLIWSNSKGEWQTSDEVTATELSSPVHMISELQRQLQQAREEIAELKTLVAFYEEQSESLRAIR